MNRSTLLLVVIALAAPCAAFAQGAGTITVAGDPPALFIGSAVPGGGLLPATDASTTYSITIVGLGMGITGQLSAPMPDGTALSISLAAPSGAQSLGPVDLTSTPQTLVRSLPIGTFSGLGIVYEFSAVATAGVVPTSTRTVTLTVIAVP